MKCLFCIFGVEGVLKLNCALITANEIPVANVFAYFFKFLDGLLCAFYAGASFTSTFYGLA